MSENKNYRDRLTQYIASLLLGGAVIEQMRQERANIKQSIKEMEQMLDRLMNADKAVVKEALREMLSEKTVEQLPALDKLMAQGGLLPQHRQMPLVIAALRSKIPIWLFGEAGSGKTTTVSLAAKRLGLSFRFISVCPTTTKSEFLGYMDAVGHYRGTAFREIFENGGVFLIDEIDNGNPSILAVLNAALANDCCAFPDGNIRRHPDAVFASAANTIGRGADIRYIGRNALDATTLDRFVFVRMDIDENLENAISGGKWNNDDQADIEEGGKISVNEWRNFVREVRKACQAIGLDHLVSPRATLYGKRLIEAGVGKKHLENMCVWKGLRETDISKVQRQL
jgi:cobaltochelatase CobS